MKIETTQTQNVQNAQAASSKSTKSSGGGVLDVSAEVLQELSGSLDTLRLTSIVRNKADLALAQIDQQQSLSDVSKYQAASDALGQIRQVFLRVRELTTRASLTSDKTEQDSIRAELQTLDQAISRIIQSTRFDGAALLSGSSESPSEIIGLLAAKGTESSSTQSGAQEAPLAVVPLAQQDKNTLTNQAWSDLFLALDTQNASLLSSLTAKAVSPLSSTLNSTLTTSDEAEKMASLLQNSLWANPEKARALAGELGQSSLLASSF